MFSHSLPIYLKKSPRAQREFITTQFTAKHCLSLIGSLLGKPRGKILQNFLEELKDILLLIEKKLKEVVEMVMCILSPRIALKDVVCVHVLLNPYVEI